MKLRRLRAYLRYGHRGTRGGTEFVFKPLLTGRPMFTWRSVKVPRELGPGNPTTRVALLHEMSDKAPYKHFLPGQLSATSFWACAVVYCCFIMVDNAGENEREAIRKKYVVYIAVFSLSFLPISPINSSIWKIESCPVVHVQKYDKSPLEFNVSGNYIIYQGDRASHENSWNSRPWMGLGYPVYLNVFI